jgi:hypothetical protein
MSLGLVLGITCAATLQAATTSFRQGVNGYTGSADTHISMAGPTTRFPNNVVVLVDNDNPVAHGLIRFDNIFGGGPGQVPLNATITSASLTIITLNDADPVWFHRMLVAWDETNNWNELSTSGPGLQADDIEMSSTPDFTFTPADPEPRVDTFDVTATVSAWHAGTLANNGWGITNQIANGWQFGSSENGTVTNRPILTIVFDAPCAPIEIVSQPQSQTVNEGGSVTFSVLANGTEPVYQWFKDGGPLTDQTNSSLTINPVLRNDEGTYTVTVNNTCTPGGPISSDNATLTVIQDNTPPTLVCAYGTNDNVTIFVQFSEIVLGGNDAVNYTIFPTGGGDQLLVATATYVGGGTQGDRVVLVLDPATPMSGGGSYDMTISEGIRDRFGNAADPSLITPIVRFPEPIFRIDANQIWRADDRGLDIGDTWKQAAYDDSGWPVMGPALLGFETAALPEPLRTPMRRTNESGGVIRTFYFRTHFNWDGPPGNGVLQFRQVLDDAAAIYVNGAEVFRIRLPAGPLNWQTEGTGDAVGDAVYAGPFTVCASNLVAGDNVIAVEVHQTGANSSDMVWGMELSKLTQSIRPCVILTEPVGTNVLEPAPFSLRVAADGSNLRYQWYLNGTAIPDATNAVYSVASSDCDVHDGAYQVVVQNDAPSSCPSATVDVQVDCDVEKPYITCLYGTNDTVVIVFNEITTNGCCVEGAEFNYYIDDENLNPLSISSVSYTSGTNTGTTVLVVIDPSTPRDPNVVYRIRVGGIQDRFQNAMDEVTMNIPFSSASAIGVNATHQWRYDTSNTDQGTAWREPGYNDSLWPQGAALFDGSRGTNGALGVDCRDTVNGTPVRTCITISNATGTAQIPAAYFRTHFNHGGSTNGVLCIRPFVDDGAVYYLNGREVLRLRMAAAPEPIFFTNLANATVGSANFGAPMYVCVSNLVAGDNVFAVEVHQSSMTSSDLTFGTELNILTEEPSVVDPARLTITRGANSVTITWTGEGVLQRSTNLSDPANWVTIAGATSGYSETTTGVTTPVFYRVRNP